MAFGTIGFGFSASGSGGGGGGLTSITANNGLSTTTVSNTQLGSTTTSGSPLLHNTYINLGNFDLNVNGDASGVFNVTITDTGVAQSNLNIDSSTIVLSLTDVAGNYTSGMDSTSLFGGAGSFRWFNIANGLYTGFYYFSTYLGWSVNNGTTQYNYRFPSAPYVANSVLADISGNGILTWATIGSIAVTSVGATLPITSSGGLTPTISTSMATNKLIGRSSAGTGVMEEISIGSGLTLSGGTLTNTATPTPTGYYGAFQDSTTQTAVSANTAYPVNFNTTDLTNGVTVVNDGSGNPTRVTLANTGIYNIQFSLQLEKTGGSGNFIVDIWIRKNGVDIPSTTGKTVLTGSASASPIVAAWNYVLDLVAGDYVQLMWATSNTNAVILASVANPPHPSIPSSILTVTQQSGIMAGTGITAINSLTGSAQTLTVGTSGTDFAINSTGSTHTFNLPTASATNRGALSSADWTIFNNKGGSTYKSTTDTTAVTGTTANTKVFGQLVLANTFTTGDILQIKARLSKVGVAGLMTLRVYINTADSLTVPAATLISTTVTASNAQINFGIDKNAIIKSSTVTQTTTATNSGLYQDPQTATTALTNSNIDWTVNQYIIFAIQNGAAGDSTVMSYFQIIKQ